jgi:hypothetical protein
LPSCPCCSLTVSYRSQSLSAFSSLAIAVVNNLSNVQCSFLQTQFYWNCICQCVCKIQEKKPPTSEFPNICHTTCHSCDTHFWYSGSSLVITHRDVGNGLCFKNTDYNILCSDCNGWGSGSSWHSCTGLKMISFNPGKDKRWNTSPPQPLSSFRSISSQGHS